MDKSFQSLGQMAVTVYDSHTVQDSQFGRKLRTVPRVSNIPLHTSNLIAQCLLSEFHGSSSHAHGYRQRSHMLRETSRPLTPPL